MTQAEMKHVGNEEHSVTASSPTATVGFNTTKSYITTVYNNHDVEKRFHLSLQEGASIFLFSNPQRSHLYQTI